MSIYESVLADILEILFSFQKSHGRWTEQQSSHFPSYMYETVNFLVFYILSQKQTFSPGWFTYIHVCMYMYCCMHTYTYIHVCMSCMYAYVHGTCTCMYVHTYIHTCTCTLHTCACTCMYNVYIRNSERKPGYENRVWRMRRSREVSTSSCTYI